MCARFLLLLLTGVACAQVRVVKVLPFAGADRVRIETTLDRWNAPELRGSIVHDETGEVLWSGPLNGASQEITGLRPKLWDLSECNLYRLTVALRRDGKDADSKTVRFGFRSFTSQDGQFLLNGRRLFLRGNAINPPGRGMSASVLTDRKFAQAYIRDLKKRNINLIRLGSEGADVWMEVCDELGMLVFQGRYGAPRGGTRTTPPPDVAASVERYKSEYFEAYLRHPSIVINILTNEMPYKGEEGEAYAKFLQAVYERLKNWDPNRLYLDNAGFGRGRSGDINDWHPYSGWYGGDFLSFYRLREVPEKVQPQTLTETVGAYTQPDGRFEIRDKQLAAALTWAGTSGEPEREGLEYQAFLTKQIVESFRRMRAMNQRLAGVMPFSYVFRFWKDVDRFEQMTPKRVADQMAVSYQPVLLSWELWTTQLYAGAKLRATAYVINDDDRAADFSGGRLEYELAAREGGPVAKGSVEFPAVRYYGVKSLPVELPIPDGVRTGDYLLRGRLVRDGEVISRNSVDVFVAAPAWARSQSASAVRAAVYDPSGKTENRLRGLAIRTANVKALAEWEDPLPLIIGEDAWDSYLSANQPGLERRVRAGARVLLLKQDAAVLQKAAPWISATIRFSNMTGMWINPERRDHPVFQGIGRERLRMWSDPTGWEQSAAGYPNIWPVALGMGLKSADDIARTAILADFRRGLEMIALAEVFQGKGSVLLSGFDLVSRSGLDPVADRLLGNLVAYCASAEAHHAAPLIDSPVDWGDYRSERGLVGGPQQGLIVNVGLKPLPHIEGPGPAAEIAIPQGRRPFGPFSYNSNCHIVEGDPDSRTGSGVVHARIPNDRRWVVTTVENPGRAPAPLAVEVNGKGAQPEMVAPHSTATVRAAVPVGATEVSVRFTGGKELVLLRTEFVP